MSNLSDHIPQTVAGFKRGDLVRVTCKKGYAVGRIEAVGTADEDFIDYDELAKGGEPMDEWGAPDCIWLDTLGGFTLSIDKEGNWERVDTEWGCGTKVKVTHES